MATTRHHASHSYRVSHENGEQIDEFFLPVPEELDPMAVEFILDVDLDQLSIYFEDKTSPHTIEEVENDFSLIVEVSSSRVVGVILNSFYERQLALRAGFVSVLRFATILAGSTILNPPSLIENESQSPQNMRSAKSDAVASVLTMIGNH